MKKGQTLLEVIIATAVIGIGLVAVLSLVVQSMSTGQQSKERTQATFLAQEGIELVQNLRDSNLKKEQDWLTGFDGGASGHYGYDYESRALNLLNEETPEERPEKGEEIVLDGISFYRFIKLSTFADGGGDKIEVSVEVVWPNEENPNGRVNLSSLITDWLSYDI